jgi:hypothetical protein
MNQKIVALLAKQEVQWESKFGRIISLAAATTKVTEKLQRLEKLNDFKH